jgi:hypothetical protein
VIGVVYLLATLVADLAYAYLNPRIRSGAEAEPAGEALVQPELYS